MEDSDNDDMRLFDNSKLAKEIIRIKHNDRSVTKFEIFGGNQMDAGRWMRLGQILGRNTRLRELGLHDWDLNVREVCVGLEDNRCIEAIAFVGANLEGTEKMRSLAPFLSRNPSLKKITIEYCDLEQGGVGILSDALLSRSVDTLQELSLSDNTLGDIDLDELVLALSRNSNLSKLWLRHIGLGRRGIASIAKLLKNRVPELTSLHLDDNSIVNKCTMELSDALLNNTCLESLSLRGNVISTAGWSSMLKLVCDYSSIDGIVRSNHTLHDLGMQVLADDRESVDDAMGVDNANLLRASLEINRSADKMLVMRQKMIWCHARGNINVGDASVPVAAMPQIFAWFGGSKTEIGKHLVQYHEPPLPIAEAEAVMLDAIFCFFNPGRKFSWQAHQQRRIPHPQSL